MAPSIVRYATSGWPVLVMVSLKPWSWKENGSDESIYLYLLKT